MKKNMRKIFAMIFSFSIFFAPTITYAHELIPAALKEYVETHPNATPDEIKQFADNQSPEFSKKYRDGAEILNLARKTNTSFFDNFLDFFKLGIIHILSGPDHVLFVLSILLVFVSWKEILKTTGAFTLAHSITLILAATKILTLSSRIVEPFIAFSIAFVAITSVFFKENKYFGSRNSKVASVFFFGLFHGLGFAGLLREISVPTDKFISSLFSFNLGIEVGQLVIVALAFPAIYFLRNKSWYPTLIKVIALLISVIALFWFIQRIVPIA